MGCHWLTLFLVYLSLCHNGNSWNPQAPREVKWFASKYCADGKGNNGTCISLQSCFADLRFPHLSGWSEFVTGDYISCAYITSQGVPFVGACCIKQSKPPSDPVIMTTENSETSPLVTQRPIFLPIPPNWPPTHPPLPTHPPHVTIPELPTHPPVAFPGIPWPWTTKRPVRKTVRPPTTIILPWIRPKSSTTTTTAAPSTLSPAGSIACGRQNDSFRVVNGKLAGYWPWMAGIIGRKGLFCGGSLISNYHILTAAHCVDRLSPGMITVRLGDQDLSSTADHNHIDVKVSSITIHPGYNTRTSQQDVAILRLASKVTFNNHIKPVCLPQNTERSYAEDTAVVIGWGATRNRGPTSKVLMELSIRVWSVAQCQQRFQKNFPGQIAATNICAGEGGKDACSGDSGGPLMKHENGVFTQIGIVSWGVGCGIYHYPGVYTRVTSFLNWIKSNLV